MCAVTAYNEPTFQNIGDENSVHTVLQMKSHSVPAGMEEEEKNGH